MPLPLEGIVILDSAHQYPGPYCSMLLGDLGYTEDNIKQFRKEGQCCWNIEVLRY